MCVLAFAWQAHPRWPLVLAGNRDERHDRPARPLARWRTPAGLIAGQDETSGGTWLGVGDEGRLAVVTNLRGYGGPDPSRVSRGALVRDWVAGDGAYANLDETALDDFNPFNLITVANGQAAFWSNRPRNAQAVLPPGLYGLANGALDEPGPRTLAIKAAMRSWLDQDHSGPEALFAPLAETAAEVFIRQPLYGTRCSTVVALDSQGQGRISERRFDAMGRLTGQTDLAFAW